MTHLLLVEDNDLNADVLARRLRRRGFDIAVAPDGQEGITYAMSNIPDIILMDLSLPVIDGWEATRRLKSHPRTMDIPVIALTGHAMGEERERAFAAGCDDFATKPV